MIDFFNVLTPFHLVIEGTTDPSTARRGMRGRPGAGGPLAGTSIISGETLPAAFLKRQLSECPSEMTETYASVDYSAAGYTPSTQQGPMSVGPSVPGGRNLIYSTRGKLPSIPQNQQMLAARIE